MIRTLIERLVAAGVDPIEAGEIIAQAVACGREGPSPARVRSERNRRYYATRLRRQASESVLKPSEPIKTPSVLKASESVLNDEPSRVGDNLLEDSLSGKKEKKRNNNTHQIGDFDAFWAAYPRKVGKGAARKAFLLGIRKVGTPDPAAILLAALGRIKPAWAKLEPDKVPHPATWLNQERWDDGEPIKIEPPPKAVTPAEQEAESERWNAYIAKRVELQNGTDPDPDEPYAGPRLVAGTG